MTQDEFDVIRMMALDESPDGVRLKKAMRLIKSLYDLEWRLDNKGITVIDLKCLLQPVKEYLDRDITNSIENIRQNYGMEYLSYEHWQGYISEEEWKEIERFKARGMIGPQEI